MAISTSGVDAVGNAVGSIFGGVGSLQTSGGYTAAAGLYQQQAGLYDQAQIASAQNESLSVQSTAIQEMQAQRQIYQTIGGQKSDVAGSGLAASGSALDVLRSSTSQGNLTMGLLNRQGAINKNGYQEEQLSYLAMAQAAQASSATAQAQASASQSSGIGGILGGLVKGAAGIASIFGL